MSIGFMSHVEFKGQGLFLYKPLTTGLQVVDCMRAGGGAGRDVEGIIERRGRIGYVGKGTTD